VTGESDSAFHLTLIEVEAWKSYLVSIGYRITKKTDILLPVFEVHKVNGKFTLGNSDSLSIWLNQRLPRNEPDGPTELTTETILSEKRLNLFGFQSWQMLMIPYGKEWKLGEEIVVKELGNLQDAYIIIPGFSADIEFVHKTTLLKIDDDTNTASLVRETTIDGSAILKALQEPNEDGSLIFDNRFISELEKSIKAYKVVSSFEYDIKTTWVKRIKMEDYGIGRMGIGNGTPIRIVVTIR
jgi:hypothetical protein